MINAESLFIALKQSEPDMRLGFECSPCFKRVCQLGHLDCLKKLPSAIVIEALGALLGFTEERVECTYC